MFSPEDEALAHAITQQAGYDMDAALALMVDKVSPALRSALSAENQRIRALVAGLDDESVEASKRQHEEVAELLGIALALPVHHLIEQWPTLRAASLEAYSEFNLPTDPPPKRVLEEQRTVCRVILGHLAARSVRKAVQ